MPLGDQEQLSQPGPSSHYALLPTWSGSADHDASSPANNTATRPLRLVSPPVTSLKAGFMAWWPEHLRPQQPSEPVSAARRRALLFSYLPDWINSAVLMVVFGLIDKVDGFKREFDLNDTSIQHTYAVNERIPFWECILLAVVVPALIIAVVSLVLRRSLWDLHNGLLGLLLSESTTLVVTDAIKITVGRPRPDLIDRCQPYPGAANAAVYGLVTSAICTQTNAHIMSEGWRSFISGHSSSAFAGLGFLSLYVAGKLHLFDRQGHSLKSWIALAPLLGATLIAISRTMDYRHHATDVIAGSAVGMALASFSYFQYYPTLTSPICHLPYAPRIPDNSNNQSRSAYEPTRLSYREEGTAPRPSHDATLEEQEGGSKTFNLV